MKFEVIYRASFYLMLTFATLVLSIDSTDDNRFSMLYPLAVAIAGVVAFLTVDQNPKLALSRNTASWLALGTLIPSFLEYHYDQNQLLLAAAHWLVYLQLVKMFLPKTVEDDWFLFLLGLVEVLVGGVISQSDKVGTALFIWALLSLWVLTLFALHRETLRMKVVPMGSPLVLGGDRAEPYHGLIDAPFIFSSARVAATTLALGGMIFLAMPRRSSMGGAQNGAPAGRHLTGFDVEIKLGQLGEILENDSPVMSVELVDLEGSHLSPDSNIEYRWRGVTMDRYEKGRWYRPQPRPSGYSPGASLPTDENKVIRQLIRLESNDNSVLFGLRPILGVSTTDKRFIPELNESDGTLFRDVDGSRYRIENRTGTTDYTVDSSNGPDQSQPGESYPLPGYLARLTAIPAELKKKLRPIALAQVKELAEDDIGGRAAALESYLRDSGQFRYSLQMERADPNLDPVEDFLVNHKKGHCEYFASALALLLRSIDIPTRMVNGFKGGDYNGVARVTIVRQKHAHSWVEALDDQVVNKDHGPLWLTLDPTPADQRNESVARVGGLASNFYQITDLVRYVWIFYIVGFNAERQDRFLYGPIRALIREAQYGFSLMGETLKNWLLFPSVESFFSLRGFFVSFGALLLLVGLARFLTWLTKRLIRRFGGARSTNSPGMAGVQFYRRLLQLLAESGLVRPPTETPREFALRAAVFLAGRGSGAELVADVPPLVVDAFYQIRFGEHTIREDDFDRVTARLDALDAFLHPAKG